MGIEASPATILRYALLCFNTVIGISVIPP